MWNRPCYISIKLLLILSKHFTTVFSAGLSSCCSASILPCGAAGVSWARSDFHLLPLHTVGDSPAPSLSLQALSSLQMDVSLNVALGVCWGAQWWQGTGLWAGDTWCSFAPVPPAVCCKGIIIDANLRHLAQDLKREYIHLANASSWKSCCRGTEPVTLKQISPFTWHKLPPWEFP